MKKFGNLHILMSMYY